MEFVEAAQAAGDSVMTRIYAHVKGDNYDITEQIDKNNGKQKSANRLTWSYANIL
jgi:GH15 family glucan-1,4-alpha-glucosidase